MKIYVNARFLTQPISGVQRYGIECSRKIKKLYPATVFLTPHNIWNKNVAKELNAIVVGTHTGHLWEQIDLVRYMRSNTNNAPLFNACNTAPLLYSNNFITLHDLAYKKYPEWNSRWFAAWYNFMVPKLVKKCTHLYTVSNTVRAEIMECYNVPDEKISVTYNGLSVEMLQVSREVAMPKEKVILAVGSFNLRKNHQSLINAFMSSTIKDTHKLVLVGDENRVFRDTGIDPHTLKMNNIVVHSNLTDAELIQLYCTAEVVVSLSVYEGFGIPLLEGLYFGCKLVCSDIAVYRELYADVATFAQPHNIDDIVAALKAAVSRAAPAAESVARLCARYNYGVSAETILQAMISSK